MDLNAVKIDIQDTIELQIFVDKASWKFFLIRWFNSLRPSFSSKINLAENMDLNAVKIDIQDTIELQIFVDKKHRGNFLIRWFNSLYVPSFSSKRHETSYRNFQMQN